MHFLLDSRRSIAVLFRGGWRSLRSPALLPGQAQFENWILRAPLYFPLPPLMLSRLSQVFSPVDWLPNQPGLMPSGIDHFFSQADRCGSEKAIDE
jgi:hypothetical protein